mmetsp:Transcript_24289/g.65858  ORF Transcript_24289/g.65858 Transcript_24289/m.65858 type:complete len:372 (-) Transcript_24289:95-1210(-)
MRAIGVARRRVATCRMCATAAATCVSAVTSSPTWVKLHRESVWKELSERQRGGRATDVEVRLCRGGEEDASCAPSFPFSTGRGGRRRLRVWRRGKAAIIPVHCLRCAPAVEPLPIPPNRPLAFAHHAPAIAQGALPPCIGAFARVVHDGHRPRSLALGARRFGALVHAPVRHEVALQGRVTRGPVLREKANVLSIQAAPPDAHLAEVAFEVVCGGVAAQVSAEHHWTHCVRLLGAARHVRGEARIDIDAHGAAIIGGHHRVPLVRGYGLLCGDDPGVHFALEDDPPLRVQAQAVLSRDTPVKLGHEHLVAVPLRGSLLMTRRQDWFCARLDVEMSLDRKGSKPAEAQIHDRVFDLDGLARAYVAGVESFSV